MKNITLVPATNERNGVEVRKTANCMNSVELRKVSVSGRDNGYIASVSSKGNVIVTGTSWRGKMAQSPVPNLQELVTERWEEIRVMI